MENLKTQKKNWEEKRSWRKGRKKKAEEEEESKRGRTEIKEMGEGDEE